MYNKFLLNTYTTGHLAMEGIEGIRRDPVTDEFVHAHDLRQKHTGLRYLNLFFHL